MSDQGYDKTVASFPTYAALTQTQAWGGAATQPVSERAFAAVMPADFGARYSEGTLLGVGGMGKVVLARDARIGRDVAVKQLHADREIGDEQRARFLREARVQGQLEHPSIVPVYDLDQLPNGATFFTMRRVLGHTLHAILDELRAGTAPPRHSQRELLAAFATVCLTIDYAHSRGVIHRDLKPANLMLGDFGEVYVLDWGLARLVDEAEPVAAEEPASRLSAPGVMMGTPLYMAPEQFADPAVGPQADVFSLGAILFEILTLRTARDPRSPYEPVDARASVREPRREVAPELEAICVRATESDPAARFPSARALHAALARYLDGDRELEQRRELAARHVAASVAALQRGDLPGADYETARGEAMRELLSAMSLDPGNREHVRSLATTMQTLPRVEPPQVAEEIEASTQVALRQGARASFFGMLVWFLMSPIVIAMGVVLHGYMIPSILGPIAAAAVLSAIAARQRHIAPPIQYAIMCCALVGMMAASRLYGPFVLGPQLIVAYALILQIHPAAGMRKWSLILSCFAIVVPMLLETVGLIPSSYVFEHGHMEILPQVVELSPRWTTVLLLAAPLVSLVSSGLFITRLRVALSDAERRLLLQAWHFRRLGER